MTGSPILGRTSFAAIPRTAKVTYTLPGVADPLSYSFPGWGPWQFEFGNCHDGAGGQGAQGGAVIDYDFSALTLSGPVSDPNGENFACNIGVSGTGCFDFYDNTGDNALAIAGGFLHASGTTQGDYAYGRWAVAGGLFSSGIYIAVAACQFTVRFGASAIAAGGRGPIFCTLQTQPGFQFDQDWPSVRFDYALGGWGICAGTDGYTVVPASVPAAGTPQVVEIVVDGSAY